ncbi:MAG: hypothetical protein WDZ52_12735 [Pseudohongiellaceae bacterium]
MKWAVNYPQISHTACGLIVAKEPQQFHTDFDGLKRMGWASSRFDTITQRQASDQKVNFEVEYSRLDATGEVIGRGYVFYIVTDCAGQCIYAEDAAAPIVSMNFDRLRERENWHSSGLGDFEIVNLSPNQVIVELSFERFDPDGVRYLTGPAVWVLCRRQDRWGIEFRSLMAPTRYTN